MSADNVKASVEGAKPFDPNDQPQQPGKQKAQGQKANYDAGCSMQPVGLCWRKDEDTPPIRISGYFEIVAQTRNAHSDCWGTLIRWNDHDGQMHQWAMPHSLLAGDASEVRARLLDGGLFVSTSKSAREMLTVFLLTANTTNRVRCVEQVGWHGGVYVTSSRTYGSDKSEDVILQTTGRVPAETVAGDFSDWQNDIAPKAVGNSRLLLAISAAFVGPLLTLIGEESFGFHFTGGSSSGKTTALRVAASVGGCPVNSWRTTDNATETQARNANDGLLILDELNQADGRAADAMSYMLGNGRGKSRMQKDTTLRPAAEWRLVFLSTGEVGLAEKVAEVGKKAKAGQSVRMIEIPADAGKGHKLFENLHGFADGAAFSDYLKEAVRQQSGHAMGLFIAMLVDNLERLPKQLRDARDQWVTQHCPVKADGQVRRVAARFGLVAAAGELASAMNILPWKAGEASRGALACFESWLAHRGGTDAAESMAGIDQVRTFIQQHGASRFTSLSEKAFPSADATTVNRAGFRRQDDSGEWDYLVLPGVWKAEICKGIDAKATARSMADAGYISVASDGMTKQVKIPGLGNTRVYHLLAGFLTGSASDA